MQIYVNLYKLDYQLGKQMSGFFCPINFVDMYFGVCILLVIVHGVIWTNGKLSVSSVKEHSFHEIFIVMHGRHFGYGGCSTRL